MSYSDKQSQSTMGPHALDGLDNWTSLIEAFVSLSPKVRPWCVG